MKVCNLLKENHIFIDLQPGDKNDVLERFVHVLKDRGLISNEKVILASLLKRESLGSTGLEKGIAIPHALTDEIKETLLVLALIKEGINFGSLDQMPTYVLILLLGNKDNPGSQLRMLAHICRLVKETDLVKKIEKAELPQDICTIFEQEEGKIG